MGMLFFQVGSQFFCHENGTVHTAGTADSNGKLRFSPIPELIHYESHEIKKFSFEFFGNR